MLKKESSENSEEDRFIEAVYNHVGKFCIETGNLLLKAPKSPELAEKLLELSIDVSAKASQALLPISKENVRIKETNPKTQVKLNKSPQTAQIEEHIMDFSYVFNDEMNSIDEALQLLNFEASQYGYKFKKGKSDKARGYSSLYCKYKPLDKSEYSEGRIVCSGYYRFKITSKNHWNLTQNRVIVHSHKGTDFETITEAMKADLIFIPRWKSISDIVSFFEVKYGVNQLNYQKVYSQVRKLKPPLGVDDCAYLNSYLMSKNFKVENKVNETDQSLCELFFVSQIMLKNDELFGDI